MKYLCFEEIGKYLNAFQLEVKTKTKQFAIKNEASGIVLGYVKWYAPWRKYCFFTAHSDLIFDAGCLTEIKDFIDGLMSERKGG